MAGFFEIAGLEQRKRALTAESEIYRETLKLEVQNLRLYGIGLRRRFNFVSSVAPLFILTAPLIRALARRSRPHKRKRSLLAKVLLAWRVYRQFSPFVASFLGRNAGLRLQHRD